MGGVLAEAIRVGRLLVAVEATSDAS